MLWLSLLQGGFVPDPCEECVSPLVCWDVAGECPRTLVAQWLSPLHPGLAAGRLCSWPKVDQWLYHGLGVQEMSYGYVFSHAAPFVGSGRENGAFRKIGACLGLCWGTESRADKSCCTTLRWYFEFVPLCTGRDSLTASRNKTRASLCKMKHWPSPGFVTGKRAN